MGTGRGNGKPVPGNKGGGAGAGRQLPGWAGQTERGSPAALPNSPAIKSRSAPASLPARFPSSGKCTSHFGFSLVSEFSLPGGSVDYFIVSARRGKAVDFVGVELQTLDTTGDWWPLRQRELRSVGVPVDLDPQGEQKPRGINWKMTAKTILMQMHHKIETFESVNRKLVLVVQDKLLEYMKREFAFDHVSEPHVAGDSMHIHAYQADRVERGFQLNLTRRLSTDAAGVATCLGLQAEPNVALTDLFRGLEGRMSDETRFVPVG